MFTLSHWKIALFVNVLEPLQFTWLNVFFIPVILVVEEAISSREDLYVIGK